MSNWKEKTVHVKFRFVNPDLDCRVSNSLPQNPKIECFSYYLDCFGVVYPSRGHPMVLGTDWRCLEPTNRGMLLPTHSVSYIGNFCQVCFHETPQTALELCFVREFADAHE